MRLPGLPSAGTKIEDLKCKVCGKTAPEQPNDMVDCDNKACPHPKKTKEDQ